MFGVNWKDLPDDLEFILQHGGYQSIASRSGCDFELRPFGGSWWSDEEESWW